jgi:hypothetical protein
MFTYISSKTINTIHHALRPRFILITLPVTEKYIDEDILKVNAHPKSHQYTCPADGNPELRLKKGELGKWLQDIENRHRGFQKNHNTYYGFVGE